MRQMAHFCAVRDLDLRLQMDQRKINAWRGFAINFPSCWMIDK
jgi:hypothetical protein